jgi:hypothetical protein
MAYTVTDFRPRTLKADLIAMGVQKLRDGGCSACLGDPFG